MECAATENVLVVTGALDRQEHRERKAGQDPMSAILCKVGGGGSNVKKDSVHLNEMLRDADADPDGDSDSDSDSESDSDPDPDPDLDLNASLGGRSTCLLLCSHSRLEAVNGYVESTLDLADLERMWVDCSVHVRGCSRDSPLQVSPGPEVKTTRLGMDSHRAAPARSRGI
jgi:hypothetical protein